MAEGCEKVSCLLNPARPVLAPYVRHAQQPWSQQQWGQQLLDRQLSLYMDGKESEDKKTTSGGTALGCSLLITPYGTLKTQ